MARIKTLGPRASSKARGKPALQNAKAWRGYFEAVKGLSVEGADTELVELATLDAQYSEKMANTLQTVQFFFNANKPKDGATAFLQGCGPVANYLIKVQEKYDFLRITLAKRYKLDFPAMRATASLVQDDQDEKEAKDEEKVAANLLKLGKTFLNNADLRQRQKAKQWFEKVIEQHPTTAAAKEAKKLLDGME